jgi:hypothetical protein
MGVLIAQHLTLDLDVSTTLPQATDSRPTIPEATRGQETRTRASKAARKHNQRSRNPDCRSRERGCDRGEPNNKLGGGGCLLLYSFEPQT